MRTFDTGATRDSDDTKMDFEGFLSPLVLEMFGQYMNTHRVQPDGDLRDSDNWQKGIPLDVYMKSMFRHFVDLWMLHRGWVTEAMAERAKSDGKHLDRDFLMREALSALLFNVQGYAHEYIIGEIVHAEIKPLGEPAHSSPTPDKDGWIENTGEQPVSGDEKIDVKIEGGIYEGKTAHNWSWDIDDKAGCNISHWRYAAEGNPGGTD